MNYKTFTSKLIDPSKSKSILIDDINLEVDERGIIVGAVVKEAEDDKYDGAANALVSLYQGTSLSSCYPVYHTYTDKNGRFLFPVNSIHSSYMIKVLYCRIDDEAYKPYSSKPFKVTKGSVYKTVCYLEKENQRIISGTLTNILQEPRKNTPIKLYLTIGPDKIPIIQLANTKTDTAGHFDFYISAEGNYCITISI